MPSRKMYGDTQKVKDGLSVLYWGHANNKFLQTSSLNNFRGAPDAYASLIGSGG